MDGVKSSNYVLSPRSHKNDDWKPQHTLDTRPNSATRHFQHFTVQCNDLKKWCLYSFKDSTRLKFSQRTFTAFKRSMRVFQILPHKSNPIFQCIKKNPENFRRVPWQVLQHTSCSRSGNGNNPQSLITLNCLHNKQHGSERCSGFTLRHLQGAITTEL
jgi:hypothetical protein